MYMLEVLPPLSWFVIVSLGALIVLYFFSVRDDGVLNHSQEPYKRELLGIFLSMCLLIAFGGFVARMYIYPDVDSGIFSNISKHHIELNGYQFNGSLHWADGSHPEQALFVDETGKLVLDSVEGGIRLRMDGYGRPAWVHVDSSKYRLVSPAVILSASSPWSFNVGNDSISIIYLPGKLEKKSFPKSGSEVKVADRFVITLNSTTDTLTFQLDKLPQVLRSGLQLSEMLRSLPDTSWSRYSNLMPILKGTVLLRDTVNFGGMSSLSTGGQRLHVFPSHELKEELTGFMDTASAFVPFGSWFLTGFGNDRDHKGLNRSQVYCVKLGDEGIEVLSKHPDCYPLKGDTGDILVRMLITSSKAILAVENPNYSGAYLFDHADFPNSIHRHRAELIYRVGASSARPRFLLRDWHRSDPTYPFDTVSVGQHITLGNPDVVGAKFIISIQDREQMFYWQGVHLIFWFLILYMVFFGLYLSVLHPLKRVTHLEIALLVILFVWLLIRFIIGWRIAVFPPLEGITKMEYEKLVDIEYVLWGTIHPILILLFILVIYRLYRFLKTLSPLISLLNQLYSKFEKRISSVNARFKSLTIKHVVDWKDYSKMILFFGASYFLAFLLVWRFGPSLGDTLKRVLPFLVFFYLEWWLYSKNHTSFLVSKTHGPWKNWCRRWVPTMLNAGLVILIFIETDMALALVMTAFILTYWACTLFIGYSAKTIKVVGIPVSLVVGIVFFGFSVFLLFFNADVVNNCPDSVLKSIPERLERIAFRAMVVEKDAGQLIVERSIPFGSEQMNKLLNADVNRWLMGQYLNGPEGVYFKIRDHFKIGSDHLTQTRDLAVLRYVLYEHGRSLWFLLFLTICLIPLFTVPYRMKGRYDRIYGYIPFGIALLLVVYGLSLIPAVLNKTMFIGQDFYFLSFTGKGSSITWILLFSLIIVLSKRAKSGSILEFSHRPGCGLSSAAALIGVLYIFGAKGHEGGYLIDRFKEADKVVRSLFSDSQLTGETSQVVAYVKEEMDRADLRGYEELDTAFVKSLINQARQPGRSLQSDSDPIHLIREADGSHFLAVNQSLYRYSPPKNLERDRKRSIRMYGEHRPTPYSLYVSIADGRTVFDTILGQIEHNSRLKISPLGELEVIVVPATEDGPPSLVIRTEHHSASSTSPTDTGKVFQYEIQALLTPYIESMPERDLNIASVSPGSEIIVKNKNSGQVYRIGLRASSAGYLAASSWVNGAMRTFYPLGQNYPWAYALAENHLRHSPESSTDTCRLTLKSDLTLELTDTLSMLNCEALISAVDEQGRVWLSIDHNRTNTSESVLDPNDGNSFEQLLRDYYFDRSYIQSVRKNLGNRNIRYWTSGPGSTLKPILYTSVVTNGSAEDAYPGLRWSQLQVSDNSLTDSYADKKTELLIKEITSSGYADLHTSTPKVYSDVVEYIAGSSNIYHSVIYLLGTHHKNKDTLLVPCSSTSSAYPLIYNADNGTHLKFRSEALKFSRNGAKNSALANGLRNIFGIVDNEFTSQGGVDMHLLFDEHFLGKEYRDSSFSTGSIFSEFVFPRNSYFRTANLRIDDFTKSVNNPVLGGAPLELTPLKMAEAGSRLFSKRYVNAHLLENSDVKAQEIVIPEWNNDKDLALHALFKGMHASLSWGTAASYGSPMADTVYVYAKTGTNSNMDSEIDSTRTRNKYLLLVYSLNPLHQTVGSWRDTQANRVLSFFIALPSVGIRDTAPSNAGKVIRSIRRVIERSPEFKQHFEQR